MDDTLKRNVLRRAKLVCHNRLRWEKLRQTTVQYFPLEVSWLCIKSMSSIILHSARGKRRLYIREVRL